MVNIVLYDFMEKTRNNLLRWSFYQRCNSLFINWRILSLWIRYWYPVSNVSWMHFQSRLLWNQFYMILFINTIYYTILNMNFWDTTRRDHALISYNSFNIFFISSWWKFSDGTVFCIRETFNFVHIFCKLFPFIRCAMKKNIAWI